MPKVEENAEARYRSSRVCTGGDSFLLLRVLSEVWPTSKRKGQRCEETSVGAMLMTAASV